MGADRFLLLKKARFRHESKELGELRRRFRPDRSAISRVYGCYVNSAREIVSYLDESLGRMAQEEVENTWAF